MKKFDYYDMNNEIESQEYIYFETIKPDRVIKNQNAYKITYIPPQFVVNGFYIVTIRNKVQRVSIFGYHANADPNTGIFCLPDHKLNMNFDESYLDLLRTNLRTYYLDNAHFIPGKMDLEKMKSMYLKFNR